MSRFGATVRSLRFRLGISQEELAGRADLHRTYIAGVESGARNVTLKSIHKISHALGVSTATLLAYAGEAASGGEARDLARELPPGQFVDILLVEDNPRDVELTLQAFRDARIANRIRVARDGEEALHLLLRGGDSSQGRPERLPQVILLDLNLPKVEGLEVLRRIKRDPGTHEIPVIVLTASDKSQDILESRRLGADAYIVKPVGFQNFSQATPQFSLQWALFKPATPSTG